MAFKRYARALTSKRDIQFEYWMDELRKNAADVVPEKQVIRTAKQVLTRCDPKQFLLSHATIVASVDTFSPKNSATGRSVCEKGSEIEVRFTDYRIKPECQSLINNNGDAWSRPLLMSTYKTFVGAPNYLEHIQLPALSKGFIVDAIARDVGNSCYIDILVATDRKHAKLVSDILSGKINSLSMGCISLFTVCTRCGNVAADDSTLCSHVMYDGKGSNFIEEDGQEYRLAELIGHVTVPDSNQFIEASWVHNPAFRGAVRRSFLNEDEIVGNLGFATRLSESSELAEMRTGGMEFSVPSRSASTKSRVALGDDPPLGDAKDDAPGDAPAGDDAPSGGDDEDVSDSELSFDADSDTTLDDKPASSKDKIQGLADKIKEQVLQLVVDDLSDELKPTAEEVGTAAPPPDMDLNDTLLAFDSQLQKKFAGHIKLIRWASSVNRDLRRTRSYRKYSSRDLVLFSWIEDVVRGKAHDPSFYAVAMDVGALDAYPSQNSFLANCSIKLNRPMSAKIEKFFLDKGRIASLSAR